MHKLHSLLLPRILGVNAIILMLVGCNQSILTEDEKRMLKKDPIDRDINLSRQEFKDAVRPAYKHPLHDLPGQHAERNGQEGKSGALAYEPIVISPDAPPNISNKLVSLSVTEDVPIRDVLVELARLADLELALDSNISGGVIMKVQDRPVNDVVALLADLASLRYSVDNGVLHVQKDTPYLVNYQVDYINLVRSSKGNITTQTQVLSVEVGNGGSGGGSGGSSSGGGGSGGGSNQGLNSGSSNEIETSYDGDLWASVEANIKSILHANIKNLSTADDNVEVADSANNSQSSQNQANATGKIPATSFYAINRQAGVLSIMASSKKQQEVKKYLDKIKQNLSAQVLIEAKLVEITLDQEYAAGINWGNLRAKGVITSVDTSPQSLSTGSFFAGLLSSDLLSVSKNPSTAGKTTEVLKFLEGFGTTRVLQNPRVSALNNQQAVLTFATNLPYFTVQGTLQNPVVSGNGNTVAQPVSITSQLHTIPIGVIMALQPSINSDTQEVTLNIRPTISKQVGSPISDPAVQILSQSLTGTPINSAIPVVEVREMDTVLKLKSGEVMLLGGLIENVDTNTDTGVPFLSGIPFFGNLGKAVSKTTSIKETVILLQATIITPNGHYHPQDKAVYQQFGQDPRPLLF